MENTVTDFLPAVLDATTCPAFRLPQLEDLQALLPDAHIEEVGNRQELVIYTGWTLGEDGRTLVPMDPKHD